MASKRMRCCWRKSAMVISFTEGSRLGGATKLFQSKELALLAEKSRRAHQVPHCPSPLMLRYFLSVLLLALPAVLRAQSLQFSIRDSTSRQPLIGASVGVPGTGTGGTTNARGAGQLTPAPAVGTRLQVEALGYQSRTVVAPAPGGAPLIVLLAPSAAEIEEVVVTATRTTSRIEDQP
ncbi:MAG: hypothetical protein EOO57_01485, partial [Hymenobacter sp.]